MILAVRLPHIDANLPAAMVSTWLVEPGAPVAYGQPLCSLVVTDIVRLRTEAASRANSLIKAKRRQRRSKVNLQTDSGRIEVNYELLASEPVSIVRIEALADTRVEPGSLLAVASTDPEVRESATLGGDDPAMRVVLRLTEGGSEW